MLVLFLPLEGRRLAAAMVANEFEIIRKRTKRNKRKEQTFPSRRNFQVIANAMVKANNPWKSLRKREGRIGFVEVRKHLVNGRRELKEERVIDEFEKVIEKKLKKKI